MTKIKKPFDFTTRKGRQRFYQSTLWRKLRDIHINYNPICVNCQGIAVDIDHIEDIIDAPHLALEPKNLQSFCKPCHSSKTQQTTHEKYVLKNRKWDLSNFK